MASDCPFCDASEAVLRGPGVYARFDAHPVNPGHLLVLPVRHVPTWFDASADEKAALVALVDDARRLLDERYAPDGYNIGVNVGAASGQTVMHLHVHLIPRYRGDVPEPRGGVRGVIPAKQSY
ncbi:MAG: HIT family protein [Burkholderiales bacterium]|nr:HIT family protein [Burkholderiales bacterium]